MNIPPEQPCRTIVPTDGYDTWFASDIREGEQEIESLTRDGSMRAHKYTDANDPAM
jgi:hypothetical protein